MGKRFALALKVVFQKAKKAGGRGRGRAQVSFSKTLSVPFKPLTFAVFVCNRPGQSITPRANFVLLFVSPAYSLNQVRP